MFNRFVLLKKAVIISGSVKWNWMMIYGIESEQK